MSEMQKWEQLPKQPPVFIDTSGMELETSKLCKGRDTIMVILQISKLKLGATMMISFLLY